MVAGLRGLFERLLLLDRVHNSDDFERAVGLLAEWTAAVGMRGTCVVHRIPSGGDYNWWIVPPRWRVLDFRVEDLRGRVVLDRFHPLVLTPYSCSFDGVVSRDELLARIHSVPEKPDAVPFVFRRMYRHWDKGWGIALPHAMLARLDQDRYRVRIATEFTAEPMVMLEYRLQGASDAWIAMAAHLDHPGQCNDSLSGCVGALLTLLELERRLPVTRFSYSVLLCPEIVGSTVLLERDRAWRDKVQYCLCPNMLMHDAPLVFCRSKMQRSQLDLAIEMSLLHEQAEHITGLWHQYADCGDEISYDAPGIGIPSSTVSRVGERFAHYHTSLDGIDQFNEPRLMEAVRVMAGALAMLEANAVPRRRFSGNPALANPGLGLYMEPVNLNNRLNPDANRVVRHLRGGKAVNLRMFQEFFMSNMEGAASLVDICHGSDMPFDFVAAVARAWADKGMIALGAAPGRDHVGKVVPCNFQRRDRLDAD